MPSPVLEAQSPLRGFKHQYGRTQVSEIESTAIYSLALSKDSSAAKQAVEQAVSAQWPDVGNTSTSADGKTRLLGLQQDQVFAILDCDNDLSKVANAPSAGEAVYITDQSDSWAGLVLNGSESVSALERICPIDLHPTAFPVGHVTRTSMEHLAVIISRIADDTYLLLSPASSARSFLHAVDTSFRNIG